MPNITSIIPTHPPNTIIQFLYNTAIVSLNNTAMWYPHMGLYLSDLRLLISAETCRFYCGFASADFHAEAGEKKSLILKSASADFVVDAQQNLPQNPQHYVTEGFYYGFTPSPH